ncbi:DUF302 domain-containing protein [Shimia marina]|uniref:DUF302 domain-containing protein n=1 Tax=Shimia marina TaxID=321267 RepID=A0A0P1ERY5_9RHOB|nr:DUF302 domain-containing protein [Shimia marina]CUH52849.1 hypothetical protein SHM7688_02296 [Shimia marina]SFD88836.1 Uncharacterized conserved protein, DUF302 family [Shimia marina]
MKPQRAALATACLCLFAGVLCAAPTTQNKVDDAILTLKQKAQVAHLDVIADIDHARLATQAGQPMPPARVVLLSDAKLNSQILAENIRAGLDLPFRVLAYDQSGEARLIYTDFVFIKRRHGLSAEFAPRFSATLEALVSEVTLPSAPAPTAQMAKDHGILSLFSRHDFETTVQNLRDVVTAQQDTLWFAEIDFTKDAHSEGITLPNAIVLLFGGPAPGGIAMRAHPAIGLDAFCQKLLVYEDTAGQVHVLYNDIAAFAMLHYGSSDRSHHALNERLTQTFKSAIQ